MHGDACWLQAQIQKCGEDVAELKRVMGLERMHHDITVPQMKDYEFQHFKFGMGTPQAHKALEESVMQLVKEHHHPHAQQS